jgi:hypothetical protein
VNFYSKVADHVPDEELIPYLLEYAQSSRHQLRSFYFKVIVGAANSLSISTFMERLWPAAIRLVEDPVVSVKFTFLSVSAQLKGFFRKNEISTAEMIVTKMFMAMGKDSDPCLQSMWRDSCNCFKAGVFPSEGESRISFRKDTSQLARSAHVLMPPVGITSSRVGDSRLKAARTALPRPIVPPMPKPHRTKKWSLEGQRMRIPRVENDHL